MKKQKNNNYLLIGLLVLAAGGFGLFYYFSEKKRKEKEMELEAALNNSSVQNYLRNNPAPAQNTAAWQTWAQALLGILGAVLPNIKWKKDDAGIITNFVRSPEGPQGGTAPGGNFDFSAFGNFANWFNVNSGGFSFGPQNVFQNLLQPKP